MEILKHLMLSFISISTLTVLVHPESRSGFISIDCGLPENSEYTVKKTGINYTSDVKFTETGVNYNISSEYTSSTLEQQFLNVRSFPEGKRNCYTMRPARENIKFLIRASFMYGNYDGQSKVPRFDLLLGAEVWDSVELEDASTIATKEIIYTPRSSYVHVCLVNTGFGTPFISSLEFRALKNTTYPTQSGSLLPYLRWDLGSTTNETIRYHDDIYDRIWEPYNRADWTRISTSLEVKADIDYQQPSAVMSTGVTPANGNDSLSFSWATSDNTSQYYIYLHFAELQRDQITNHTRKMYIFANGRLWYGSPLVLRYLVALTLHSIGPMDKLEISINKTEDSLLPPIINAIEICKVKDFLQLLTNQQDVDAITNIKTHYGVKKSNWHGDPCTPQDYLWEGLDCSYDEYNPPRIIILNLSSSGLVGEIPPFISSFTAMESLDLSNNNLIGPVPDFLPQLPHLKVLNLAGNKLEGSVPAELIERRDNGLLVLSVDGNSDLCLSNSCTKRKKVVVPVLASVAAVSVLIAASSILWILKRRNKGVIWNNKNGALELNNRRFLYSEVVRMTNNFERIIGKGGFGTVYHGNLDDTQVAVKMLSPSAIQGYKQFQAEVELLMRVHHKNLTTLIGYCDDGTNRGLIYEFMANGNLESHLLDEESCTVQVDVLSWEERLRIATEAAQGLEYLHSGCKPPIIHRDIKPTNILLDEKLQAKIADFGISRILPVETGTHITTAVAGTPGYLDPEYYASNKLAEKSDVFSFGVVLLQLIASKPAIERSKDRTHIIQWVSFMLAKGDIENVVDPRLHGDCDMNSVSKAVAVAMACVSQNSAERPTMNQVVFDLNESLAIETAFTKGSQETKSIESVGSISQNMPCLAR